MTFISPSHVYVNYLTETTNKFFVKNELNKYNCKTLLVMIK